MFPIGTEKHGKGFEKSSNRGCGVSWSGNPENVWNGFLDFQKKFSKIPIGSYLKCAPSQLELGQRPPMPIGNHALRTGAQLVNKRH